MSVPRSVVVRKRRELVLLELARRGGRVGPGEWKAIGEQYGYDARGLGGFFVGDSSVREMHGVYTLTPRGWRVVGGALREVTRAKSGNPWRDNPPPIVVNRGKTMSQTVIEMREEER